MSDSYQAIYDAVRSRISNGNVGDIAESVLRDAFDISHARMIVAQEISCAAANVAQEMSRPCVLYRPALSPDGTKWCALYGVNLVEGVAGFGDTPEEAMADFDKNWRTDRTYAAKRKIQAIEEEDAQRERDDNGPFGVGA